MSEEPNILRRFSSKAKQATSTSPSSSSSDPSFDPSSTSHNLIEKKLLESLDKVTHGGNQDDGRIDAVDEQRQDSHTSAFNAGPGVSNEDLSKRTKNSDLDGMENNPMSRWYLHIRALTLRNLASLGFALHNRSDPPAPSPTQTKWIDSTVSKWSGKRKISLDIWTPTSEKGGVNEDEDGRIGVISFHGGGFILGNGTDDSRWAGALMDQLDAVVIAVNYRMAPGHPFPTPVEDCVDAIIHIHNQAKSYGINPDKLFLSGFSAGGNLIFSSYFLLQESTKYGYPSLPVPKIKGIIRFYPLLDFTIPRHDKRKNCIKPEMTLPDSMTSLFDQSYLHPIPTGRSDPRISPARASDDLLRTLPNVHLCCCEWDMLYKKGKEFKDRLEGLGDGRKVGWRVVKEEAHGWDKPPPLTVKPSVGEEYTAAIQSMKGWLKE